MTKGEELANIKFTESEHREEWPRRLDAKQANAVFVDDVLERGRV